MNKSMKYLFLIFSAVLMLEVQAYTNNQTDNGSTVKWRTSRPELVVHQSSSGLISGIDVVNVVEDSIHQWEQASPDLKVQAQYVSASSPNLGVNDLYFSMDDSFLGPSVAGVTVTTTNQTSGELIEADIIINDALPLSTDPENNYYIGDIISHELGHYLGLAHSEVVFATMFFRLTRGQHKVNDDDRAGVRSLYSPRKFSRLSGRVIGGESLIEVFGAHVQAFSLRTGDIAGSAVTGPDGQFEIEGLEGNDNYYLYVDKLKSPENLPLRYKGVKSDFCHSGRSYRGSFFQSCYTRDEGRPQAVYLERGSSKSVGEITIRCGLETPVDYMQAKSSGPLELRLTEFRGEKVHIGESLVGFFNQGDVEDRIDDQFVFEVDVNDLPVQSAEENFFIEVKSISQGLKSPLRISMELENAAASLITSQSTDQLMTREDGSFNIENTLRMPISLSDPGANSFNLKLTPESLESYSDRTGESLNKFIPDYASFSDFLSFYFLTIHIVQEVNGEYFHVSSENGNEVSSNKFCPAAPRTYSVDKTRTLSSQLGTSLNRSSSQTEINALGCGMILLNSKGGPPGPGRGAFVLTLFSLCLILVSVATRRLQNQHL